MELTPLRYFRAIASAGHMTRAARSLGVSQPALSAMLKKLEAEAGTSLLNRTGRGVELSEAGKVFLKHADEAIRRADSGLLAVRQLLGLETGSIRTGAGATAAAYLLPPVVSAIRKQHPGLKFYVRETGSTAVAAAVLSGELDLGVVTLPLRGIGAARTGAKAELLTIRLVEDELRLIVPPGHALAGKKGFRWKDLEHESVIGFEAGSAVRDVLDTAAERAGVVLEVVMELRSIQSIQKMVAAGVGVGFVSRFALAEGKGDGLICREGKLSRQLAIVRRSDHAPSAAIAQFERTLLEQVRAKARKAASV